MGKMGRANLAVAMRQENVQVVSVCDIFPRNLEWALESARKKFPETKPIKDFREVLADRSVDIVCIATPDHWHPYMTIEACKAGKDVYVEKPLSATIREGRAMVDAARKHQRVVQVGLHRRSTEAYAKIAEVLKTGTIGKITVARAYRINNMSP